LEEMQGGIAGELANSKESASSLILDLQDNHFNGKILVIEN
jgi:hypothetical protein